MQVWNSVDELFDSLPSEFREKIREWLNGRSDLDELDRRIGTIRKFLDEHVAAHSTARSQIHEFRRWIQVLEDFRRSVVSFNEQEGRSFKAD